jgi:3-carboxy-cis,cis-muconate cycloisomerase
MGLWAVEWIALPQALILAGGIADKLATVLEGLALDGERMRANLDLTGGQIMAEAVTMALARAIGHEPAHAAVLAASRRALAAGRPLLEELADDEAVSAHVGRADLERIMDPASYLGLSARSAESVARRVLGEPLGRPSAGGALGG